MRKAIALPRFVICLVALAFKLCGHPGRYYAVLRNTAVIPAIFGSIFEGAACRMASK
jgi:hypothetical protein